MLQQEVLELLTVSEWAQFKEFVHERPTPVITTQEGKVYKDYLESDLHEFMTLIGRKHAIQAVQ